MITPRLLAGETREGHLNTHLGVWSRGYRVRAWELISNKSCHVKWTSDLCDRGSSDVRAPEICILEVTPS